MATTNAASVTGEAIRVTALDSTGKFVVGDKSSYVSESFISVSFTPEYEDGDEFTQKNAKGAVCVTFKAPDTLKRINLSIAICDPNPELTSLLGGGQLLMKGQDVIGWAAPKVGEDPSPNGVAVEVWSNAIIDGKPAASGRYFHWVFPYAKLRESGERVIQNDMLATEFEGWAVGNLGFGAGPAAPAWAFPQATDRSYGYARVDTLPVGRGFQPATNTTP